MERQPNIQEGPSLSDRWNFVRAPLAETSGWINTIARVGRDLEAHEDFYLNSFIGLTKFFSSAPNLKWDGSAMQSDFKAGIEGLKEKEIGTSSLSFARLIKRVNGTGLAVAFAVSGIAEISGYGLNSPWIYRALFLSKVIGLAYQAPVLYQSKQLVDKWDEAKEPEELIALFSEWIPHHPASGDGNEQPNLVKEKGLEHITSRKSLPLIKEGIALLQNGDTAEGMKKLDEAKRLTKEEIFSNQIGIAANLNFMAKLGLVSLIPSAAPIGAAMTIGGATLTLWKMTYDLGLYKKKEEAKEPAP